MLKKFGIIIVLLAALGILTFIFWPKTETTQPGEEVPVGEAPFGTPSEDSGTPFGVSDSYVGEIPPTGQSGATPTSGETAKLFRLSSAPVAGFVAYARATSTLVRFVDRGTGHIYDALLPAKAGEKFNVTRITNNTLSPVYEATFRSDASSLLIRLLDEAGNENNLLLTLTAPKATSTDLYTISSVSLRGDIESPLAGAGNTLYYVASDSGAVSSISFQGDGVRSLWTSGLKSWRVGSLGANLLLTTKASAEVPGYAYSTTSAGSLPAKLLGPLSGLSAIGNKPGNKLLYSYTSGNRTLMRVRTLSTGTEASIEPGTLAEKCVWGTQSADVFFCGTPISAPGGEEPDDWYQGKVSFNDYVWRYDTKSEVSTLIVEPQDEFNVSLDVFRPALSPDESYFVFINKRDLSLWAVSLR